MKLFLAFFAVSTLFTAPFANAEGADMKVLASGGQAPWITKVDNELLKQKIEGMRPITVKLHYIFNDLRIGVKTPKQALDGSSTPISDLNTKLSDLTDIIPGSPALDKDDGVIAAYSRLTGWFSGLAKPMGGGESLDTAKELMAVKDKAARYRSSACQLAGALRDFDKELRNGTVDYIPSEETKKWREMMQAINLLNSNLYDADADKRTAPCQIQLS